MDRFETCHAITATWEGGWSDHPADPGGKTMYGITEARWYEYCDKMGWKRTPVRTVTLAMALVFYRSEFWKACGAETLYPGVDLAVYDASVNSGVSRGKKWLQAAAGSNDHSETVRRICRARLGFMQSLKIWKTFGKGWGRRVADIEAKGVTMALTAMGVAQGQVQATLGNEAQKATKAATSAKQKAVLSGTGATGTGATANVSTVDHTAIDWTNFTIVCCVIVALAVVAIYLVAKSKQASARADAYAAVAQGA